MPKFFSMNQRYCLRLFRVFIILLTICILLLWLIPSIILNFGKTNVDLMEYENYFDNHVYPPPWYISNWTINDYFIRKDHFKKIEDQHAIDKNQKIFIDDADRHRKKGKNSNYIILEYTTVFNRPKFCGKTQDSIFGKKCPYQNCR